MFNDSIHMTIELNPLECAILQTPEFFRLKNIKQLGKIRLKELYILLEIQRSNIVELQRTCIL